MAKRKKSAKQISNNETVHFRPNAEVGRLIADLADQWSLSRGETAKRLTTLAAHGMTLRFYPIIAEFEEDLKEYGGFDAAVHQIHTAILEEAQHSGGVAKLTEQKRLAISQEVVKRYRSIRGQEETPQTEKTKVRQQIRE